jgi:hypothetical protein
MSGDILDAALDVLYENSGGNVQQQRNAVLDVFDGVVPPKRAKASARLHAIILCVPCGGLGDAVFGVKLRRYLQEWYGSIMTVDIATTAPALFKKLGEKNIIHLSIHGAPECRRIGSAFLPSRYKHAKPDLIFVAPVIEDRRVDFLDVRRLFPTSTQFNTYFFSEYNTTVRPEMDFPTGLGKNRLGLLFTTLKPGAYPRELASRGTPFALAYVASSHQSPAKCVGNFVRMVAAKYLPEAKKHGEFHVIIPEAVVRMFSVSTLRDLADGYAGVIVKTGDDDSKEVWTRPPGSSAPVLVLRGDVLPLPLKRMQTYMYHSVRDILVTGDQSITDAISACPREKTVWYQIMDWKMNLAKELAIWAKNDALESKSTSCGGLDYIDFNRTSCNVLKHWDFRKLARSKLDGVVAHATLRRFSPSFAREEDSFVK